jgi:hypothetical protein
MYAQGRPICTPEETQECAGVQAVKNVPACRVLLLRWSQVAPKPSRYNSKRSVQNAIPILSVHCQCHPVAYRLPLTGRAWEQCTPCRAARQIRRIFNAQKLIPAAVEDALTTGDDNCQASEMIHACSWGQVPVKAIQELTVLPASTLPLSSDFKSRGIVCDSVRWCLSRDKLEAGQMRGSGGCECTS